MKPFSLLLTIILGLVSLSLVVLIAGPRTTKVPDKNQGPTVDDLPMPKSGPYGKAEVPEAEFNFGARKVGDNDEHTFTIKNDGEGILEFKMGKPTCQCTVGEITKNGEKIEGGPLNPGESINILVKWVMKAPMEKFRQVVPVFTTDPERRKVELTIIGSVDSPYHMKPEGPWNVGDISATEPSVANGFVFSTVVDEFKLEEVPRENARAKLTFEPGDPAIMHPQKILSGYTIKVEVGPNVPVGPYRETIKLKATSKLGEDTTEFTVTGHRAGPIDVRGVTGAFFNVETNRLMFKDFPAAVGAKATLNLFVKNFDGDLILQSVEPTDSRIKVNFPESGVALGKAKSYQVQIEIPPGPVGKHRMMDADVIDLKLNHPEVPDFKLVIDYSATH